jgi:hypothetical protein
VPVEVERSPPRLSQSPDLEGPKDVVHALEERPDHGADQQHVGPLDEELSARREREHDHRYAGDQAKPPELVHPALAEGLDDPEDPHDQEQEAEHVGDPGEGVLGADEGDDSGDHEQDAEEDEHPADHAVHQPRDHELLDARSQEDRADQDAHSGDRRLVELQDHQCIQDPDEAEHQPEPSELAQAYEDFPHFTSLC